jgi:hypothetical protein
MILTKTQLNYIEQLKTKKETPRKLSEILKAETNKNIVKTQGIVFTPIELVDYIFKDMLDISEWQNKKIVDIAVGNGVFLIGFLINLKEQNPEIELRPLVENNLYGYDLEKVNVEYTKLNLKLLLEYYGENTENLKLNIEQVNSLEKFKNRKEGFDIILGNPPYVKQQNLTIEQRKYLEENFKTINSNFNLSYAFLEIIVNLLKSNGIAIQVVPNNLLKLKSASTLREYLIQNKVLDSIVDFDKYKIFKDIGTYTMVLKLSKKENKELKYKKIEEQPDYSKILKMPWQKTTRISKDSIDLISKEEEKIIEAVENNYYKLITATGISTQNNTLYLVEKDKSDYYKEYKGIRYKIDSKSIKPIYKCSMQNKNSLNKEYIIYPYENGKIKPEEVLKTTEPNTYKYLIAIKEELYKRSGIEKNEIYWYKYGRSQAINNFQEKIIYPMTSKEPNFIHIKEEALYYNGNAILEIKGKDKNLDLETAELILNSEIIEKYVACKSHCISGGYYNYNKKVTSKITIPEITEEQKVRLKGENKEEVIKELYKIGN